MNGKEQRGKRPVLILANIKTDIIIVVPLTSNIQTLKFPRTLEIKKSKENGLERASIVLIFQIQSLDKKRFINRIGVLEDFYVDKIDKTLRDLFNL